MATERPPSAVVGARRERGFALLIVLWALVFLAFVMSQILSTTRTSVVLADNLRTAAAARAACDGAISVAVFHMLASGAQHWPVGGVVRPVVVGGVAVAVQSRSLAGMVNPNVASLALLTGLLEAVGVTDSEAAAVGGAIVAWRSPPVSVVSGAAAVAEYRRAGLAYGPPASPFNDLAELGYVLGVTPDILARLRPHMSLFNPGDPLPAAADDVVRRALASAAAVGDTGGEYEGAVAVEVTACARGAAGLCRVGVVSLPGLAALTPYKFLALGDAQ